MNLRPAERAHLPSRIVGRSAHFEAQRRFVGAVVAAAFDVEPKALTKRGRAAPVAIARQVAMYLAYTRFSLPYSIAGELFRRDRTTAAHACAKVEDLRENSEFDALVDHLERALDAWASQMRSAGGAS